MFGSCLLISISSCYSQAILINFLVSSPFRIAVLASGNGTDLQAIIDELKAGTMPGIELALVVSNREKSFALGRARNQGYTAVFVSPKGKSPENYDQELVALLQQAQVDLVVLAGFMRILTPVFIKAFPQRIVNIHPSLLPKFGGKGMYGDHVHQAVLDAGKKETGCTFHFVTEDVDSGPIILQKKVPIVSGETVETLRAKVQALEKQWYPEVVRRLAKKEGGKKLDL